MIAQRLEVPMSSEPTPPSRRDHAFEDAQRRYYTKQRVKLLLMLYPYLLDSKPPQDPELAAISHRVFGPGGWKWEAATKRADIRAALDWLHTRDERAELAVRLYYCVGEGGRTMTTTEVAQAVHKSQPTAWRWIDDGVSLMAWWLCGRQNPDSLDADE